MIGVDSNVVIRHLMQDDQPQALVAGAFLAERTPDDPAFVSTEVLVEVIGVLMYRYRVERADIHRMIDVLLRTREVLLESPAAVRRALRDADDAELDLVDALIAHAAIDAGCDGIVTFDKAAQRLPGMLPVA